MDHKKKQDLLPNREDLIYKEIEEFEDFELINNAFYEMGIRSKNFQKLVEKYAYCEKLSKKLYQHFDLEKYLTTENIPKQNSENEITHITYREKTAEESFEEAFKELNKGAYDGYDIVFKRILELDFENFKKKVEILNIESKTNNEILDHYNYIGEYLYLIPEVIKKDFCIDLYSFYNQEDNNKVQKDIEYEESSATALHIKREFKGNHYIETVIDPDSKKITKTLFFLPKRKLLIDHIVKFSFNNLMLHRPVIKNVNDFFKVAKSKVKKQKALADAFFCYDYYHYRLEEVSKKNQDLKNKNLENVILQEALESIEKIHKSINITDSEKKEMKMPYEKTIKDEELTLLKEPTLHKSTERYVFNESRFQKSGINSNTALKYYQWIKKYIDGQYMEVINKEISL